MDALIGPGHVAAAEPDPDLFAIDDHRGVADHLGVPGLGAGKYLRQLAPMDAVGGACQSQPAPFAAVAAGEQHPIESVELPDGRFAHAVFIECSRAAGRKNRIGPQLFPIDAVAGAG